MAYYKLLPNSKFSFYHCVNKSLRHYSSKSVLHFTFKQVPSIKLNQCISNRSYSIFSKQIWHRHCNLRPVSASAGTKMFMSTGEMTEKYNVVVTNPTGAANLSEKVTQGIETSSSITSASSTIPEVSQVLSSTPELVDTATTLSGELSSTIQQIGEPTLASLGLGSHYTPVGWVQMFLEYLHIGCDLPWWVAIAASTVVARILLIPLLIKTQRNALKMSNHMPQLQYLQAKFGEARKSGNVIEASKYSHEIMTFMKEKEVNPIKSALLPLAQAPIFVSFFMGLRAMAKAPVESMKTGGISWVTDLTVPDPYYVLPAVACGTLYIVLKLGAESGIKMENLKMARYLVQALPVIAFPFCMNFPSAVLYYWVTTNFCTLAIVSVLKIKPVRKYLKLPEQQPLDPKYVMPKKGFIDGAKEAYEDQKVLGVIQDRRRIDENRFLKCGTGPVPRTYSYDPTKPRPSNAAVSAKRQ